MAEKYTALVRLTLELEFEVEADSPEQAEELASWKGLEWQPVNRETGEEQEWSEMLFGVD
jgi:hypothetical protein